MSYTDCALTVARFTDRDAKHDTDPNSAFWAGASSILAQSDTFGRPVPGHRTEIYAQWGSTHLYFLFVCAYDALHLRPSPATGTKTQELWNWDVAEVFIGSDFEHIGRYKEFEVSPQGEWLDIAVDLDKSNIPKEWLWSSGVEAAAHIAADEQTWYGFLRIPYSSIDDRPAAAGNRLRINFFRSQGPPEAYREIAWQPCYQASFHVPEFFGILQLLPPVSQELPLG
jgi:hypothetical protein